MMVKCKIIVNRKGRGEGERWHGHSNISFSFLAGGRTGVKLKVKCYKSGKKQHQRRFKHNKKTKSQSKIKILLQPGFDKILECGQAAGLLIKT